MSSNLLELEHLELSEDCNISDKSLELISKLTNLKILNLNSCNDALITDTGFKSLSNLPKLEALDVSFCENITGKGLGGLSNLRAFYCLQCQNLEDTGLINLLKCANNIQFFDCRNCPKITQSLVNVAIDVTKNRTNNVLLNLHVSGCRKINVEKIDKMSPFLYLH